MKKLFRKNQIIVTALAMLIAISGYINYMGDDKDAKAKDAASNKTVEESTVEPGDAILTNSGSIVSKVAELKISREQTRAKNLESLYEIVNNEQLAEADKQVAIESVNKLVENSEKELAIEIMLEGKGFQNVMASISDNGIDIMLDLTNVDDASRAQIEDMVVRKTGISLDKVVITPLQGTVSEVETEAETESLQ